MISSKPSEKLVPHAPRRNEMSVAVLVVIFVSGFVFSGTYPPARFKQLRSTGWDSYSHIASWGLLFCAIGGLCVLIFDTLNFASLFFSWFSADLNQFAKSSLFSPREGLFVVWGVISIALAWTSAQLFTTPASKKRAIARLATDNAFELMLYDSAEQVKPVLISLSSRKVYIGVVYRINNDDALGRTDYFSILPLWSGYRDKDSLRLKITTFYEDHYSLVRAQGPMTNEGIFDQFKIVICSAEVSTLSYFEIRVYHELEPDEDDNGRGAENTAD